MASFNIENVSGVTLNIDDLGVFLDVGEEIDINLTATALDIAISANGGDLETVVNTGDIVVKDPFDGGTILSISDLSLIHI